MKNCAGKLEKICVAIAASDAVCSPHFLTQIGKLGPGRIGETGAGGFPSFARTQMELRSQPHTGHEGIQGLVRYARNPLGRSKL